LDNEGKAELAARPPGGSFTIPEWCRHRRMSISMYYKLRTQGKSPATLDVGRHKTITAEADAAWVQKQAASLSDNHISNDHDRKPVVAPARAGLGRLDAAKNGHGP
jgi:hypothetical protein